MKDSTPVKVGLNDEEIKVKVLTLPGPFCTRKRIYSSFSSSQRTSPQHTEKCMKELEAIGLGKCVINGKVLVFYKVLPSKIVYSDLLQPFQLIWDQYQEHFKLTDPLTTRYQRQKLFNAHPEKRLLEDEGVDIAVWDYGNNNILCSYQRVVYSVFISKIAHDNNEMV